MISNRDLSRHSRSLIENGLAQLAGAEGEARQQLVELIERGADWTFSRMADEGQFSAAIELARKVLDTFSTILGPRQPATIQAKHLLGRALFIGSRPEAAVDVLEDTLADQISVLGPEHERTITTRFLLIRAGQASGALMRDQAIAPLETLSADAERILGPDEPFTLTIRNTTAFTYRTSGRLEQAIPLHESVLADRERVLGPTHPDTLRSRSNLAHAYFTDGRTSTVIPMLRQVLQEAETQLGGRHPETLGYRNNLAQIMRTHGDRSESMRLLEQVLRDREEVLGPSHPDVDATRLGLAVGYIDAGRKREAADLAERVVSGIRDRAGPVTDRTIGLYGQSAAVLAAAGRDKRAEQVLSYALRDAESVLGSDHAVTRQLKTLRRGVRNPVPATAVRSSHSRTRARTRADYDLKIGPRLASGAGIAISGVVVYLASGSTAPLWLSAGFLTFRVILPIVAGLIVSWRGRY